MRSNHHQTIQIILMLIRTTINVQIQQHIHYKKTRATLINIGKVLNYKDKIEAPNKNDNDSTLRFLISEIPDFPLTLNDNKTFDMIYHTFPCPSENEKFSTDISTCMYLLKNTKLQIINTYTHKHVSCYSLNFTC